MRLPNYGITPEEVAAVRQAVRAGEFDAVVFVADTPENTIDALEAVAERARELLDGVPAENSNRKRRWNLPVTCVQDPGAARMYPKPDIPKL